MNYGALLLTSMLIMSMLSGCFGNEVIEEEEIIESPFNFEQAIPDGVWYHYSGGVNALNSTAVAAANITANLSGNNTPIFSNGSYYSIGRSTFEPTIGITSADNLYMASYGNGPSGSTAVVQCSGLIEMTETLDYSCVNVYDPLLPVANSNDPYIYVDKWTDRIMKFDMHALLGMTVEWSDNEGDSFSPPTVATSVYSVQDHQTITSAKYPAALHETTWVYCINGNAPHPLCSSSFDGGSTWSPEVSGAPLLCQSGGLTAHLEGGVNGNFYRGNIGCNGEGYSIYRSTDGGYTWSEHPLPTTESGTADTWNGEEAQVAVDDEGNVYAMWMGYDNMPYIAYSRDAGDSWSEEMMIAPPTNISGTGFPVITAGGEGRIAMGYVGEEGLNQWHAYMTVITDVFSENPLMTTTRVNDIDDPIDVEADCGYNRCGGLGDFLDMSVDQYGRPWFGLSHNLEDRGIFATMSDGPSLRGDFGALNSMPIGGKKTL
jgi:hypothetical protein